MKQSYFQVGRKLTPSEWEELKAWRKANPELRWKCGDTHPETGLRFWSYTKGTNNGEWWISDDKLVENRARHAAHRRRYYADNPDPWRAAAKAARLADPEKAKAKDRAQYAKHREVIRQRATEHYAQHRDERREYQRKWGQANAERLRERRRAKWHADLENNRKKARERVRLRRQTDPMFALAKRCRGRVWHALTNRGYGKRSRTAQILGAEWGVVAAHIENLFLPGMSWENRGEWHIDHVIPLASAKSEEEMLALCHYTNLQPLWALDNRIKGAKLLG